MKKNPIDYLFYKLVEFTFLIRGSYTNYNAVPIMSALFVVNIASILMCSLDADCQKTLILISICLFVSMLIIFGIVYWGKRGKRILKHYEEESKEERIRGNKIVIWYVILTIAFFAYSIYLWNKK